MGAVYFPDWAEILDGDVSLNPSQKHSFRITIRWFLSYCKRRGRGADFEQAKAFIAFVESDRQPQPRVLEYWKEALRWFFRAAKGKRGNLQPGHHGGGSASVRSLVGPPESSEARPAAAGARGPEVQAVRLKESEPAWRLQAIKGARIRQFSYRTEKSYLQWLGRFGRYWKTLDLEALGENEIKLYLDHLAVTERVSGGTQRLALNALVFYYREVLKRELGDFSDYKKATTSRRIPVVLSVDEIRRMLAEMTPPYQLMAQLQYGAGLRVSELARLRIKDLDFDRKELIVRGGKGDKDRTSLLPESLIELLKKQEAAARQLYEKDRQARVAGVWLPEALGRKFRRGAERWEWFWFWPANGLAEDPRSPGTVRRHHVATKVYQSAITRAAQAAGIPKRVTSHALRHSFASHLLHSGTDICRLQELLGHSDLETTRIYLHVDGSVKTKSPVDALAVC